MGIPIENIYYLLSYAWNKLEEKDRVNVSIDDKTELLDLFAKILINATRILLKRGIDKSYLEYTDELAGIKGKLEIGQTVKRNILFKQRTVCSFDEFSANIVSNRILYTTLYKLSRTKDLDKGLREQLVGLQRMMINVDPIEIKPSLFRQIRLNRNNRFYGYVMQVCQIIHESTLPSEEPGKYRFTDFTRDERKMNRLFEAFVKNFYAREQDKFNSVRREIIKWQFTELDSLSHEYLPQMETDITLENEREKIIIDAKYYSETMAMNYDREKIKSNNLYQLFSYLLNQEDGSHKSTTATGILLYPTIEREYDLHYLYKQHAVQIKSINLNTNWKDISRRLKEIIQET